MHRSSRHGVRALDSEPAARTTGQPLQLLALHALTSMYGQLADTSTSMHWVMVTAQALIAIGFFVAGRAGMSTRES